MEYNSYLRMCSLATGCMGALVMSKKGDSGLLGLLEVIRWMGCLGMEGWGSESYRTPLQGIKRDLKA